jgi:UDPglucose 6-dehydrogenase
MEPSEGFPSNNVHTIPARTPNLFFSTNIAQCISEADMVFVAVNTPTKTKGIGAGSATDMTAFEAVIKIVAQHARPGTIIVEKSTVPCKTAQLVKDTVSITALSTN